MRILRHDRVGMTLVELLVAMVVAAIILQGAVGFFIGQSRLVGESESRRSARDVGRSAMNVFMADLRRVETSNGIQSATSREVEVLSPFALGVVCDDPGVLSGNLVVSLLPTDPIRLTRAIDQGFAGYAKRLTTGGYGSLQTGGGSAAKLQPSGSSACTDNGIDAGGAVVDVNASIFSGLGAGDILFFYDRIRYEFVEGSSPDEWLLVREVNDGPVEELAGPFDASGTRFRFFAAGSSVAADAPPSPLSEMRGLEIVLRGKGDRPRPGSATVATAPITASVFFKNRP